MPWLSLASAVCADARNASSARTASGWAEVAATPPENTVVIWIAGGRGPMTSMPGFDALRKQQEAFLKSMMGGVAGWPGASSGPEQEPATEKGEDLAEIRKQLAELQAKLSKL